MINGLLKKIKLANNLYAKNQSRTNSIFTNVTSTLSIASYLLVPSK